ncbi:uncharacterized protein HRG_02245 [Hirsutella rhossiliensis]|uniref:Ketosynthase family 3 (KS3) domain-containing protein n=1 Tax=Hirsutella rhossiliensis TaxID=111463 RepID=A0A9P8N6F4_9HYPO|nr:uncharacterized protein HRG_02245 [Hirsutella rhossiliensis]KAH0966836.1 hypothetical protein HRG_02245 [Hirsutella rhossiliensis]
MGELYPETNGSQPDCVNEQPWGPSMLDEDPVCIIGMACRLPGGIKSPSDLWDFLVKKKSAQEKIPPSRFNVQGFYSPSGDKTGINNLEATYMDPQQRKLLEATFECFESANVSTEQASGDNIGVYVASFTDDHFLMQMRDPDSLHRYHGTGSDTTLLANRSVMCSIFTAPALLWIPLARHLFTVSTPL